MEWTAIVGGIVASLNAINLLLSWRARADIAELHLSITERLVSSEKDVREWVEDEFARKDVVQAQFGSLKCSRPPVH